MTLQDIRKMLQDRNLAVVAEATGLSSQTLYRLMRGRVKPHNSTLRLLTSYLTEREVARG